MSVVTYTTFDGELVEENRDGTILDYIPDSLGSIIMWVDETGLPASYTPYWPYGEPWQEPEVECPFQFVGTYGYYRDLSGTYVRAREYEPEIGRWLTVDPLWPQEPMYGYGANSPLVNVDPLGKQAWTSVRFGQVSAGALGRLGQTQPSPCTDKKLKRGACDSGFWATCAAMCKHEFGTIWHDYWTLPSCRAVCCQCNPCESFDGHSSHNEALKECTKAGEKPSLSKKEPATHCRGTHYTYRMKPKNRLVTVLCCECVDANFNVQTRCRCK